MTDDDPDLPPPRATVPRARRWRVALAAAVCAALAASEAGAQARVTERHEFDEPEGRLLAFYAATLAYSPAGLHGGERLSLGLELSYVPWLDAEQRRPSIDKPEATNLAPVFPRPRIATRLGRLNVEASWIPPVRLFDVEANVLNLALSRTVATVGGTSFTPRLWGTTGRVRGAMTCNEDTMLGHGADLESYFATVCHGQESEDWFEPQSLGAELVVSRSVGAAVAYVAAGVRRDHTTFDIGVKTNAGGRDPDHPILELRATRPQVALGARWHPRPRWSTSAEAFYAPGSLLTARVAARWVVRP